MRLILLLLILPSSFAHAACVILLHGLARTDNSMSELESKLGEAGFTVVNTGYPSRRHSIEELAEIAIPPALESCDESSPVHFVTHSLGGILVRQYLQQHDIENLEHVVMLGPPNQGSELVDTLNAIPGFRLLNGQAGVQLGTDEQSITEELGPANFDVGIIAGTRSINPLYSALLPGDDDGKVTVESTRLDGMHEHIEMATTHTFMMNNNRVIEQVLHYLHHGEFLREENRP